MDRLVGAASLYSESDLLPISALQHLRYCPRQCALIHIEGLWAENRLTVEGRRVHRRVHGEEAAAAGRPKGRREGRRGTPRIERRGPVRLVRGLPIASLWLGLFGVADLVEFHDGGRVIPVEYKRGKPKRDGCDEAQLCAQALCLEETLAGGGPSPATRGSTPSQFKSAEGGGEMLSGTACDHGLAHVPVSSRIERGAIYYARIQRRVEVVFTDELRERTAQDAARLRDLIASGITPRIRYERRKCDRCSLKEICLPTGTGPGRSVARYIARATAGFGEDAGDDE